MNKKYFLWNKASVMLWFMMCITLLLGAGRVSAAETKLPSGIAYSELQGKIEAYFEEHKETSAGFAYSVFDNEGDIASGYLGYADKENAVEVSDDTVFEWGSGSKMLVWVSVMQMVEQGKIDLDTDIREYLPEDFLSNLNYDTPVTMTHLMNHSAGFQDEPTDMSVVVDGYLTTLEEAVSAHKPEQIYEPGTVTAYSNWGTSLAAYIVERQANMEFTEYVHEYIFKPLGMENCAFSSNLSDNQWVKDQRNNLHCYDSTGSYLENSQYYCTLYPAGGCVSTFEEYSKFAKALLSRSDLLMKEKTWELFFTPTDYFGNTETAKNSHGLWYVYFAVPTVGHIGKTSGCSSYILLDIEKQIGAALICNQGNETILTEDMMSLVYGDYKTSSYYAGDAVPDGMYRCAKMVEKGPFKFTGILGTLSKDLSKEFWTLTSEASGNVLEIGYMDYVEISQNQIALEYGLLGAYVICMILLTLLLLIRVIAGIVRIIGRKKSNKYALRFWSVIITFLVLAVPVLNLLLLQSTANPSPSFIWISQVTCGIMVVLVLLIVYGLIRTILAKLPIRCRLYNIFVAVVAAIAVANIVYWELYMFWKI